MPSYDSDTEPESQAGSPVKTRKKMVNGKSSRGSPKKTAASSNRQPPVVVKEDVPEEPAGHNGEAQHEGEEDGAVPSDVNVVIDPFIGG